MPAKDSALFKVQIYNTDLSDVSTCWSSTWLGYNFLYLYSLLSPLLMVLNGPQTKLHLLVSNADDIKLPNRKSFLAPLY